MALANSCQEGITPQKYFPTLKKMIYLNLVQKIYSQTTRYTNRHPLNTDTLLIQTLFMPPSVSVFKTGFDCITDLKNRCIPRIFNNFLQLIKFVGWGWDR